MTAYSKAAAKNACDAAKKGHTMPACAARAGIDRATLYRWINNHEEFSVAFAQAMTEGRAALEDRALALAERDDGKHAIELLSRRYPKAWGRADRVRVDAKVEHSGGLSSLSAKERLAAIQRMMPALVEAAEKEKE